MEDKSGKNFLCVPIQQGAFSIVMEGKGDKTLLSRVPAAAN